MLQNILTLRYECRYQDWGASLISASIFQGAGARLKIQFVFCANMSTCFCLAVWEMTERLLDREGGRSHSVSYGEKPVFPALGPTWMPLGRGQDALGSVLLIGRFSPRWMQETLACHLLEESWHANLCAFCLLVKLMQALV